jgi:hypothetical protein
MNDPPETCAEEFNIVKFFMKLLVRNIYIKPPFIKETLFCEKEELNSRLSILLQKITPLPLAKELYISRKSIITVGKFWRYMAPPSPAEETFI